MSLENDCAAKSVAPCASRAVSKSIGIATNRAMAEKLCRIGDLLVDVSFKTPLLLVKWQLGELYRLSRGTTRGA